MKTWIIRCTSIVILLVIVAHVATSGVVPTAGASLSLGNVQYPVRCYNIGNSASYTLICVTPAGSPSFVSSQRVPEGYYFLITDVMITPTGSLAADNVVLDLNNAYGAGSIQSINHFRVLDGSTFGQHFNAPMWVLFPDHYLSVVQDADNQSTYDIRVNGFLVTNGTYLPMVMNDDQQ
jgi:hypothetical protein